MNKEHVKTLFFYFFINLLIHIPFFFRPLVGIDSYYFINMFSLPNWVYLLLPIIGVSLVAWFVYLIAWNTESIKEVSFYGGLFILFSPFFYYLSVNFENDVIGYLLIAYWFYVFAIVKKNELGSMLRLFSLFLFFSSYWKGFYVIPLLFLLDFMTFKGDYRTMLIKDRIDLIRVLSWGLFFVGMVNFLPSIWSYIRFDPFWFILYLGVFIIVLNDLSFRFRLQIVDITPYLLYNSLFVGLFVPDMLGMACFFFSTYILFMPLDEIKKWLNYSLIFLILFSAVFWLKAKPEPIEWMNIKEIVRLTNGELVNNPWNMGYWINNLGGKACSYSTDYTRNNKIIKCDTPFAIQKKDLNLTSHKLVWCGSRYCLWKGEGSV